MKIKPTDIYEEVVKINLDEYDIIALNESIIVKGIDLHLEEEFLKYHLDDKKVSAGIVKYMGDDCDRVKLEDIVLFPAIATMKSVKGLLTLPEDHVVNILRKKIK